MAVQKGCATVYQFTNGCGAGHADAADYWDTQKNEGDWGPPPCVHHDSA